MLRCLSRVFSIVVAITCLILHVQSAPGGAQLDSATDIQPLGSDTYLVEARVVDVQMTNVRITKTKFHESFIGTMKISHVYCGASTLLGVEFSARTEKHAQPFFRRDFLDPPLLKVGETGLWILVKQPEGNLTPALEMNRATHVWPVRQGISPRYDEALDLAQAIEKVASAPSSADQFNLTKSFAKSRRPSLSLWAIETLGWLGTAGWAAEDVVRFLEELTQDQRVPVVGQVAIDNALLALPRAGWKDSPLRLELLERWVTARLSVEDADEMAGQIHLLAQRPTYAGFDIDETLALIGTAIENEGLPLTTRERLLWTVPNTMPVRLRRFKDDEPAFEFLVDVVQHGSVPGLRRNAARCLAAFLETEPERRRGVILELLSATNDEQLAKDLTASLAPTKPKVSNKSKLIDLDDYNKAFNP